MIHHLVGVIAVVGKDGDAAVRESVTLTRDGVMDELAADFAGDMLDDAALFAKFSKENRTAAQKLLDSLKEFLNKVRGLFTGKYRDMAAQEAYGKDFAELEDISKQWQAAFDAAERQAEKAKTAAGEGDGARYSLKKSGIDKYYARQIDQWDGKDHGGAFRVGAVSDALLKVGVPDVDIWFDQSKAAKQLEGKSKITKDVLKQIPEVLESPVAISESYDNTVMVFGQLFDGGGNPIVVAIRISSTNRRNHISIVNKSRSVGTRSHNLDALLADDKLLYWGENKKETKKWFNALGRSTPFGGTKFGLIRSISNPVENVKPKFSLKAYSEAEKKGHVKSAKEFFGETNNWNETGYITTDGTKLDFSGRHEGAPGGQTGRRGDGRVRRRAVLAAISIHAPREGGRPLTSRTASTSSAHFNPRPRAGGRPCSRPSVRLPASISIHAPARGGDPCRCCATGRYRNFNPRPREGGRQWSSFLL